MKHHIMLIPLKRPVVVFSHLLLAVAAITALTGCGNQPPAPDWALNAEAAAQKGSTAYLQGKQRIDVLQWSKAREAVASTARPDLAARMELIRCAAQVASLDWSACSAYEALAQDAQPAEQAYARYLEGKPLQADVALLPKEQQPVAARVPLGQTGSSAGAPSAAVLEEISRIQDPLSRLLAAAVLLRAGGASPQLLDLGVQTASSQGWSRALMAWLLLQAKAADQAGDASAAAAIRRRLDLLGK